jgi:glycosyltransferase involved in cell wall biosynthesis
VVPSLEAEEGCSINEAELIKVIGERSSKFHVISFVSVHKYLLRLGKRKKMSLEHNATVIILPTLCLPFKSILSYMALISVYLDSLSALLVAFLLKLSGSADFVYIRDPRLAVAFVPFKTRFRGLAIKFAGFYVQEILNLSKFVESILERINSICVGAADLIIVHSELYEPILRTRYQRPLLNVVVLQPGIRTKELSACLNSVRHPTLKNLTDVDAFKIGFIGSTAWWNGADLLIEAISYAKAKSKTALVLFVAGLSNKQSLRSMMDRCNRLKVKAIFCGLLPHDEALYLMSRMDVIIAPRSRTVSTETTIPIKIAEAFALGIPVIVTKHKIFETKYTEYKDVVYCDTNPQSIAEKIVKLVNDPLLRDRVSKQGRINATEFDYHIQVNRLFKAMAK